MLFELFLLPFYRKLGVRMHCSRNAIRDFYTWKKELLLIETVKPTTAVSNYNTNTSCYYAAQCSYWALVIPTLCTSLHIHALPSQTTWGFFYVKKDDSEWNSTYQLLNQLQLFRITTPMHADILLHDVLFRLLLHPHNRNSSIRKHCCYNTQHTISHVFLCAIFTVVVQLTVRKLSYSPQTMAALPHCVDSFVCEVNGDPVFLRSSALSYTNSLYE
jgi:hypothetical protein